MCYCWHCAAFYPVWAGVLLGLECPQCSHRLGEILNLYAAELLMPSAY